ncbi:MAG: hypothetical protein EPN45_09550 [Rhizobiaceae bacterium]|nr:MAG: hypothetical protein EPN45_09550 [Rhizobiaceae bacterium]
MSEIISFPGTSERIWRELEGALREVIAERGLDEAALKWIMADIRPRLWLLQRQITVTVVEGEAAEAVRQIITFFREVQNGLISELLSLEIALYQAAQS